ncbi:MAG: tyrosine-protein phosphatase [Clostridiales bacterium]|nr:tyrosine-protein phosphatase [Clostridiales bacterium]
MRIRKDCIRKAILMIIMMALLIPAPVMGKSSAKNKVRLKDHEIKFDRILNARDLGGYKTAKGKRIVKKGILIRSGELAYASSADIKRLKKKYKLKKIVDLRYPGDHNNCPDRKIGKAMNKSIPVRPSYSGNASAARSRYNRLKKKSDRKLRKAAIPDFDRVSRSYTYDLVMSSYSKKRYRKFFKVLLNNEKGKGVLFHCIYGKDRTGVAAFMTLVALGVDEETAYKEFSLTNTYLKKYGKKQYQNSNIGVSEKDLRYAVSKAKKKYGSLNRFLKKAYGLNYANRKKLRKIYTEIINTEGENK